MSEFTYKLPEAGDYFETLKKYLASSNQKDLLLLVEEGDLIFKPTSTFTNKVWNTWWCSIIISVPIDILESVNKGIETRFKKYCEDLLPPDCGYLIDEIKFVPQLVQKVEEKAPDLEVLFEEQKEKIISELANAKFVIWIAVAWFTLDEIYNLLIEKVKEGLDVRIVVSKDDINKAKYEKYKSALNLKAHPQFGYYEDNIMHNKFCVIDLKKVIHGSYNWSKRAEHNKETVEIVDDFRTAETFSEEFKKLYLEATGW